jgi:hypothetical protein
MLFDLLSSCSGLMKHAGATTPTAVTVPTLTFNVLQSCTPRVGPLRSRCGTGGSRRDGSHAEAYHTAAVQNRGRRCSQCCCVSRGGCRDRPTAAAEPGVLECQCLLHRSLIQHRLVVTLKQWSLPCEARQMVVDPYARSAEPSRIVQAQCRSALQSSSGFDLVDSSSACSGRPLRAGPDPADRSPEGGHQEICPREAHLHTRTRMPTAIKVSSTAHHSASEGDTIARARR